MVKNAPALAIGDTGSIPGSGRSLAGGNGNPLQYSCLATHFSILAWRIPSGPPSIGSQELNLTEHTYKNTG